MEVQKVCLTRVLRAGKDTLTLLLWNTER